jgi:large subunit ribosomal protein L24
MGSQSMLIKKDDQVVVLAGDDRGARGTVKITMPKEKKLIVSGVHLVKKHQKPTGSTRTQVGIIEREAPVDASNVALWCQKCEKPAKVRILRGADGTQSRVCRRCGEAV